MWGSISTNSRMLNQNIDVPKYSEPSKISLGYPDYPKNNPKFSSMVSSKVCSICSLGDPDHILKVR